MSLGNSPSSDDDEAAAAAQDEAEWWEGRVLDGDVAGAPPLAPPASSSGQVPALSDREVEDDDASASGRRAKAEDGLAVLGDTCPICLQTLEAPVMLRACYHVFCDECLRTWVASAALMGVRPPPCPLCKARFDAAYANVRSETDYETVYFDGRPSTSSSSRSSNGARHRSQLTSRERVEKRELVYRRRLVLAAVNGVAVDDVQGPLAYQAIVKLRGEYEPWLERELHACIGRDVDLTVLLAIVRCCLDKAPRFGASSCYKELETALAPFLYEDAAPFVRELAFFLASRLNVDAYDEAVQYRCGNTAAECAAGLCPFHHQSDNNGR